MTQPQVLILAEHRVGPAPLVPMVEGAALLVLVGIAGRPGPVPRGPVGRAHPVLRA